MGSIIRKGIFDPSGQAFTVHPWGNVNDTIFFSHRLHGPRKASFVVFDEPVGRLDDFPAGTVVRLQAVDVEFMLMLDKVFRDGSAPRIDRLVDISDRKQFRSQKRPEPADDPPLERVDVLDLVDEQMLYVQIPGDQGKQQVEPDQDASVGERVVFRAAADEFLEQAVRGMVLVRFDALLVVSGEGLVDRPFGDLPGLPVVEAEIPGRFPEQEPLFPFAVDRDVVRLQADELPEPSEIPQANCVDGADGHVTGAGSDAGFEAFLELMGGLAGEGDGEDFVR